MLYTFEKIPLPVGDRKMGGSKEEQEQEFCLGEIEVLGLCGAV